MGVGTDGTADGSSGPGPGNEWIGRRYHILERVGKGGMGTVYLARDRLAGVVALKRLHRTAQPEIAVGLADEFKVLTSLHHPHVISVLDYGFDDQQHPYYTMDLLKEAQTLTDAGKYQTHEVRIGLLAQALQALAYMHRWGVIHRDLTPGNVLVVNGQVKVLDFGLAIAREGLAIAREGLGAQRTVGTNGFVAPELYEGQAASIASDLYSLGRLAYLLMLLPGSPGRDPSFVTSPLGRVLQKLTALKPQDRYPNAEEALAALAEATGLQLPTETRATRESFLQAARFVGREREQARLEGVLDRALTGQGGAWLVGGESGVGKSRLLDAVRTLAMVRGAVTMRGQAVSGGGSPYQEWRSVLRWLTILTEPDDFQAGVLRPLVEDIEALLERPVPPVAELDPEASQARLFAVVEDLFGRLTQPTVLILEDLHWTHAESLRLLSRVATLARARPLLILTSYRDDERPELPGELPMMEVLRLPRLESEAISVLIESMVGAAGRSPQLVELLRRETEGNPFFLVEVVRALAEETGQLDRIGTAPLPPKVFPGGMRQIIQRRLSKLPPSARELLQLAAVIGRQLDVKVLRACAPSILLDAWLAECAAAAVVELFEGQWRFTHDKLREGVLADLPPRAEPLLHRRAAEAIEAVYPEAQGWTVALVLHWGKAGDSAKEALWSERAGEQALAAHACREALHHLERALVLSAPREGEALAPPRRHALGRLEAQLAEASFQLGDVVRCRAHAEKALRYFGWQMPTGGAGWGVASLAQTLYRVAQSVVPEAFEVTSAERRRPRLDAGRLLLRLAEIFIYAQDFPRLLWSGLRMLNLYEPTGPSPELARGYALMAVVAASIPQTRPISEAWLARAQEMAEQVGTPVDVAFVLTRRCVCGIALARWREMEAWFTRSLALATAQGDSRQVEETSGAFANVALYSGQYERALQFATQLEVSARRRGAVQTEHWGAMMRVGPLVRLGRYEQAIAEMEPEVSWFETSAGASERIMSIGTLALAHLHQGNTARARALAAPTLEVLRTIKPVAYWLQSGIASIAEVYLTLWEQALARPAAEPEALAQDARAALRGLNTFAQVFPFAQPAAWVCRGREAWLSGRRQEAHRAWTEALEAAERLKMPFEEGQARFELGRHLELQDPARRGHLVLARETFSLLGAVGEVARVQAELDRR